MHLKTEPGCLAAVKECRIQNTNTGRGQGKFAAGERGGGVGRRAGPVK